MDVDGPGAARKREPPDTVEQELTGQHAVRVAEQDREQVELAARQRHRRARDANLSRIPANDDVGRLERGLVQPGLGAAEHGLDAGEQLARRERLRQVVVGAELESGDAVGLLVARRQHQDRDVRVAADAAADLEPVNVRQAHVEHDDPNRAPFDFHERVLPALGPHHREPVALEIGPDERSDALVVLDHERRASPHDPPPR
jgi:hypothetical protein